MLENIIFLKVLLFKNAVRTIQKKFVFKITFALVRSLCVNLIKNFISIYINFSSIKCLNV